MTDQSPTIIFKRKRAYCPHCRVYVGILQGSSLNVGFVRLSPRAHKTIPLECVKCAGVFLVKFQFQNSVENQPQNSAENPASEIPADISA